MILTIGLIAAAFGLILIVLSVIGERYIAEIRGYLGEREIAKIIRDLGLPALHGFYATDSKGIHTQIDHLVKVPGGIIVIETKNFLGALYGQGHEKTWRHVNKGFRRTIQNPIHQNHRHVATLKEKFPDIELINLVCFNSGKFPKGIPSGVTTKDTITHILTTLEAAAETSPEVEKAWAELESLAVTQGSSHRKAHLAQLRERFNRER